MIRIKYSSGSSYYQGEEMINYATVWNKAMETKGGIRLYDGSLDMIADFSLGDTSDELNMIIYPISAKAMLTQAAASAEQEIREILLQQQEKDPSRKVYTFDLIGNAVKLLVREDFKRYSASSVPQNELFTFDNPDPTLGFPRLYIHDKAQRTSSSYGDVFPVLVRVSQYVFPTISDIPTIDGARFTFMLFKSYMEMKFESDVPHLNTIRWPTKLKCEIPPHLDMAEFQEFLLDSGTENLKVVKGEVVDDTEDDDWTLNLPGFMLYDGDAEDQLAGILWQTIQTKGFFSLRDAVTLGLDEVLSMTPISNKPIPAGIDCPGLVRKMCIYQGRFHVVPLSSSDTEDSLAQLLDIGLEALTVCNEDTFPKLMSLPAPKPKDNL